MNSPLYSNDGLTIIWQDTTEAYQNPINEGAGYIDKDSLAAESTRAGGEFGKNRNADISEDSFNPADEDTSNATKLEAAPDASDRLDKELREAPDHVKGSVGHKYAEGVDGQGEFPGKISASGYSGGSTKAKQELSGRTEDAKDSSAGSRSKKNLDEKDHSGAYDHDKDGHQSQNRTEDSSDKPSQTDNSIPQGETAPNYISPIISHGGKPKGKNLTEGGFDDDPSNNASFTAEIGSQNDPGRVSENFFQQQAESVASGGGPRQGGLRGEGQYAVLEDEQGL